MSLSNCITNLLNFKEENLISNENFFKSIVINGIRRTIIKVYKKTLEYSYSNGVMERNNNTCKLIKRISFGFRNFVNMKSRIMIITNIFRKEKREYHTKYSIHKFE